MLMHGPKPSILHVLMEDMCIMRVIALLAEALLYKSIRLECTAQARNSRQAPSAGPSSQSLRRNRPRVPRQDHEKHQYRSCLLKHL